MTTHAWFGPKGTVSPLHHDPSNNLLTQIVGSKRVLLYDRCHTSNLYPFDKNNRMRWNSSQVLELISKIEMLKILFFSLIKVDAENVDSARFPLFETTPGFECVLNAGEMLFIPPRFWHHVRSLSTSFSISFWWY